MGLVAIYPEDCVDIDATGRSGVVQLEPLVQRKIRIGQQMGQRDFQTAQCLHTIGILHLIDLTKQRATIRPQDVWLPEYQTQRSESRR